MGRTDEATAGCGFVDAHSANGFKRSFTEVLGENILSALSLAMARVPYDRDRHRAFGLVIREYLFEAIGETEEIGVSGKASL